MEFLAIIVIGSMFFGYIAKAPIFYLISGALSLYIGFENVADPIILIGMIGMALFLFVMFFLNKDNLEI